MRSAKKTRLQTVSTRGNQGKKLKEDQQASQKWIMLSSMTPVSLSKRKAMQLKESTSSNVASVSAL